MAKSKKRVRSDDLVLIPIPNWAHADDILHRMAMLQHSIEARESHCHERIATLKAQLQQEVAADQEKLSRYVLSLEVFAGQRREEIKGKSRSLQFGKLGWRASTAIRTKKTTLEKIKDVFSGSVRKACITVKEPVNKQGLAKLTDEQLSMVDARREEKDVFFVEPNLTRAIDYQKGQA